MATSPMPWKPLPGKEPTPESTQATPETAQYRKPEERCNSCTHAGLDATRCEKHGFDIEPEGVCRDYTPESAVPDPEAVSTDTADTRSTPGLREWRSL